MTRHAKSTRMAVVIMALTLVPAAAVLGGAHTWRVTELFSNADGTIQFIELSECCGLPGELGVNGGPIISNAHSFNLTGLGITAPTSNKSILIASAGFAELCGAPEPDYIIPSNLMPLFFSTTTDNVRYNVYGNIAFTAGQLPTDGINSIHKTVGGVQTTGPNSPTNYAGVTGSIDLSGPVCALRGDIDGSGELDGKDIVGFTRILLGQAQPEDNESCFEAYCDPTAEGKIAGFVADLLG